MKRNFKRTLSLILSVLMVIAVVPFSGMAAACTHPNATITVVKNELTHIIVCADCGFSAKEDCASSTTGEASCQNPKFCDVCDRELSVGTHNFNLKVEAPNALVDENVNCDEYNRYYKSCNCGRVSDKAEDIFTSTTNKGTNHDFTKKIMNEQYLAKADCGKNPNYYYACSRCNVSSKGFDGSTYANEEITVQHIFVIPNEPVQGTEKSAPTCTSPAVFYKICSECGESAKGIDETETYTYGKPASHTFIENADKEGALIIPATCSVAAMYSKSCKDCGVFAVEGLGTPGFDPNDTQIDITTEGENANAFYAGSPLNHGKLKTTKEAKAPTCTADGNTEEISCEYCGAVMVESEKINKLGHKYDSKLEQEYKAPTCKQYGQIGKVKCVNEGCGQTFAVNAKGEVMSLDNIKDFSIEPLGHIDENGDLTCDRAECGAILEPEDLCTCICHSSGFMYFIAWIIKWFWSFTGTNPYCACGIAHYEVD